MTLVQTSINATSVLITGLLRIPSLILGGTAIVLTGVVALRILKALGTAILSAMGFQTQLPRKVMESENEYQERLDIYKRDNPTIFDRVYSAVLPKPVQQMFDSLERTPTLTLLWTIAKVSAASVVLTELIRVIGGSPHPAYNIVLSFVGIFRISPQSYIEGVRASLQAMGF